MPGRMKLSEEELYQVWLRSSMLATTLELIVWSYDNGNIKAFKDSMQAARNLIDGALDESESDS